MTDKVEPPFEFLRPGEGGFDSPLIKDSFFSGGGMLFLAPTYDQDPEKNHYFRLRAAAMTYSKCAVCGKELNPLGPDDLDHHACYDLEQGNEIYHYCAEHCPACNGRDHA